MDKYFPSDSGVRIIAEPGRYYVASAFTLAVNIIAKKLVLKEQTGSDGRYKDLIIAYIYTHTHTHTHTYIYIYTHTLKVHT